MSSSDRQLGAVTVVVGDKNGKYPHGNSLWIRGREATAVVDPSLSVVARAAEFAGRADLVVQSHAHEDHLAGVHLFPQARVHVHRADALGVRSLAGLLTIYGYAHLDAAMGTFVMSQFHYAPRRDVEGFDDGAVFDLGGARIRVIHTPGHTRGHCAVLVEPDGVLFLGDIDLSSFGPYYGDAWSCLDDFEASLEVVRRIEARAWVSFHHVGIIEDRRQFLERLDRFTARIGAREAAILDALAVPRTLEDLVRQRFVYPAHVTLPFVDAVERRTIRQHLDRVLARGQAERVGPDRYVRTG